MSEADVIFGRFPEFIKEYIFFYYLIKTINSGNINFTNFSISVIFNLQNRTSQKIKKSFSKNEKK